MEHHNHIHTTHQHNEVTKNGIIKLAANATLHCLIGCGIGEVLGMVLATWWGMSMAGSMVLAIILGFVMGFALGIIPLLRKGFSFSRAFKIVFLAEGLSIIVMEAFEVLTQASIPGVLNAGLTEPIYWIGMFISLVVGFIAAFPVNYYLIRKGVRHQH